jgi:hypothetical protein
VHDVLLSDHHGRTFALSEELFVVDPDGTARPTLRLRLERDPVEPNAAGFVIPAYRFTRDGSKLVYVLDGRVHVRAIDGDATSDLVLDGDGYVDAVVRDASSG